MSELRTVEQHLDTVLAVAPTLDTDTEYEGEGPPPEPERGNDDPAPNAP